MELDHEKFAGAKELAEITTKISAATAALTALKADETTYLDEREAKLIERLKQTLVDSGELIKAIGENHDALVGYRMQVTELHDVILSLIQGIKASHKLLDDAADALDERIREYENDIESFREACRRERIQIDGERTELAQWRDKLGEDQRLLDDRTKTLERTIKRIKK